MNPIIATISNAEAQTIQAVQSSSSSSNAAVIAAVIAALAAIISPVITAKITTSHEEKMKTLELFFVAKSEAYKNFITVSSFYSDPFYEEDMKKLYDAASCALLFSSSDTQEAISQLTECLISNQSELVGVAQSQAILAMQRDLYDLENYRKSHAQSNDS